MQGSPFRSVPFGTGGTYRSDRILVHGPSATERYYRDHPSTVDFGHRRSISTINGRLREKVKEGEEEKGEKREHPRFPARSVGETRRGDALSSYKRTRRLLISLRGNEATPRLPAWE
ncbi:hypothetical protein BHE74_00052578 [Ensete ventricosum]|nr:hypothetical protein BHE74_00052578 [Ensete ventricosum]